MALQSPIRTPSMEIVSCHGCTEKGCTCRTCVMCAAREAEGHGERAGGKAGGRVLGQMLHCSSRVKTKLK